MKLSGTHQIPVYADTLLSKTRTL